MEVIFTKTLTTTDVHHKMAVPMDARRRDEVFRRVIDERGVEDLEVFDVAGNRKSFHLYTRQEGQDHPKPILTSGWLDFARENGLRAGDVVIFSKNQDNEAGRYYYKIDCELQPRQTQSFTFNGAVVDRHA